MRHTHMICMTGSHAPPPPPCLPALCLSQCCVVRGGGCLSVSFEPCSGYLVLTNFRVLFHALNRSVVPNTPPVASPQPLHPSSDHPISIVEPPSRALTLPSLPAMLTTKQQQHSPPLLLLALSPQPQRQRTSGNSSSNCFRHHRQGDVAHLSRLFGSGEDERAYTCPPAHAPALPVSLCPCPTACWRPRPPPPPTRPHRPSCRGQALTGSKQPWAMPPLINESITHYLLSDRLAHLRACLSVVHLAVVVWRRR